MSSAEVPELLTALARLGAAVALALPIGWDRSASGHGSAGLKAYPLVALGTCGFILAGWVALGSSSDEQADVLYGVVSGVGFIGGGAILKDRGSLRGMATAASLWVTIALATAAAYGLYGLAAALSLLSLGALHLPGVPRGEASP